MVEAVEGLTPGKAGLRLTSEPSKAGVYVNKKYAKMQTPSDIELDPGTYNIGLVRKNYVTWNEDLILAAGEIREKHVILEPKVAIEAIPKAEKKPTVTQRVTDLEAVVSSMITTMEEMLASIADIKKQVEAAPVEIVPVAVPPTEKIQVAAPAKLPTVCPIHNVPLIELPLPPGQETMIQLYCESEGGHEVYYGPRS